MNLIIEFGMVVVILFALLALVFFMVILARKYPLGRDSGQERMSTSTRLVIALYLGVLSIASCVAIAVLWSAEAQLTTEPRPKPACKGESPQLAGLHPSRVAVGTVPAPVLLVGCNFPADTLIKLNGASRPGQLLDQQHLRVELNRGDVSSGGTIVVTASTKAGDFGSDYLDVVQPQNSVSLFGWGPWSIGNELRLLLLVLLSGCFGSCVYALKSMADYRGQRTLYASWDLYYWIQPIEGAGLAFLMYLVIRGGFLAGGGSDLQSANLFGICAITALSGAFSDVAFLKLREIFQAWFKPQDDRGGKMVSLRITTTSLDPATVGVPYVAELKADGGSSSLQWAVTPALPSGLTLDPASGQIGGTPTAATKATLKFTVTDTGSPGSPSASQEIEIEVTVAPLAISTASLPDGVVGSEYSAQLEAEGGEGARTWSITPNLPAGLALDPATGRISGTPTAVAELTLKCTVSDSGTPVARSAEREIELNLSA
ncbi:Ig domain-containing protein [Accumulibacter sp.]|uniref:Ig domain-containing protein n=1 Tax=Accumulibacter sp. TaxID=2053492 RepID=UPI0025DF3414|nr:Ig domain-containing protein [Accumulibacter sp.]MCM8596673.1 Ig domain-containing protein [Accumulibacter sp.]MDS4050821.1 Ig domain-containing protein [Accumulibacter sp.]